MRAHIYLFFVFLFSMQTHAESFYLPDINCLQGGDCFRLTIEQMNSQSIDYKNYSVIGTHNKKTEFVFISIHGLWGDGDQFKNLNSELFIKGANILSIVLPGHGADTENGGATSFEDWREQVRRGINIAKNLGDKIIIMGQSTGGLLAVDTLIDRPQDVAGLVLLEPAMKVRGLPKFGACTLGHIIGPSATTIVGNAVGIQVTRKTAPRLDLGCEVSKLAKDVDEKFERLNNPIFSQPVYLFVNNDDNIVSSEVSQQDIQKHFSRVHTTTYDRNKDGSEQKLPHGLITNFLNQATDGGKKGFYSFLSNDFGFQPAAKPSYVQLSTSEIKSLVFKTQAILEHALSREYDFEYTYYAFKETYRSIQIFNELVNRDYFKCNSCQTSRTQTPKVIVYVDKKGVLRMQGGSEKPQADWQSEILASRSFYDWTLKFFYLDRKFYNQFYKENQLAGYALYSQAPPDFMSALNISTLLVKIQMGSGKHSNEMALSNINDNDARELRKLKPRSEYIHSVLKSLYDQRVFVQALDYL